MRDVARLAGVATMTVSRVLSGVVPVADETKQRVLDAVQRLGYRPNEIARSLREQKSRQVGIIVPNLYDPFFAMCAHAVSLVAKAHQYSVIITLSEEDAAIELEEATRLLRRHIDGLIIIPAKDKSKILGPEFSHTPVVALDRPIVGGTYDSVLVENREGARDAVEHLIAHGHKRIAYVGLSSGSYTMRRRLSGYRAAITKAILKPIEVLVGDSQDEMLVAIRDLVTQPNPPTAMFCSNNLATRNALHALAVLEIDIPARMAVVGFDDFEMADIIKPSISVVRQDPAGMGRIGGEILMRRLTNPEAAGEPEKAITLPVQLIIRDSCGTHPIKSKSK